MMMMIDCLPPRGTSPHTRTARGHGHIIYSSHTATAAHRCRGIAAPTIAQTWGTQSHSHTATARQTHSNGKRPMLT